MGRYRLGLADRCSRSAHLLLIFYLLRIAGLSTGANCLLLAVCARSAQDAIKYLPEVTR